MKRLMTCAVLLVLATAVAGCGASGSTSSPGAAASVGAAANADVTPASGVTTAAGTPVATPASAAATPASAPAAGGDTCKFLSASDAATLVANPGPVKVAVVDAPASKLTTCTWGKITTDGVLLVAQELNAAAPASEIKAAMLASVVTTIAGLGDGGGFETKTADAVTVVFVKGSTLISLSVSATGVNADAVAAAAKKMADGI